MCNEDSLSVFSMCTLPVQCQSSNHILNMINDFIAWWWIPEVDYIGIVAKGEDVDIINVLR